MAFRLFVFFFFCAYSSAFAQISQETLPLSQIVEKALENSALLASDKALLESEKSKVHQSTIWQNPSAAFSFGHIDNPDNNGLILEATLYQTIPFPGKLGAKEKSAEANRQVAEAQVADRRLKVQHEAVTLSYRLAAMSRLVRHISERSERFALARKYLASRPFASPVQEVEKDLIEHRLRFLEEHLVLRESDTRAIWHQLNVLLQMKDPVLPNVTWWKNPRVFPLEEVKPQAQESNLDLRKYRLAIDRAEADLKYARVSFWPDFNVGLGYRRENNQAYTHFYTGYLTVNIPLWDRSQNQIPIFEQIKEGDRWRYENQRRLVDQSLLQAFERLEKARKTVLIFSLDQIEKSKKSFDRADAEFRRGRLPLTSFLAIEAQSHETQDRVFEAQSEYVQSLSNLLLIAGRTMPLEAENVR